MSLLEEETELKTTFVKFYDFAKFNVTEGKFGNLTRLQMKMFSPKTYKPEDPIILKSDKGEEIEKLIPHQNYIRFRKSTKISKNNDNYINNEENQSSKPDDLANFVNLQKKNNIDCNARIVQWSDDSYQLVIGDKYFDLIMSKLDDTKVGIYDDDNKMVLIKKDIESKCIVKTTGFDDDEVVQYESKQNKVKTAYNFYDTIEYKKDSYGNIFSKSKKNEEKFALSNKKRKRSNISN